MPRFARRAFLTRRGWPTGGTGAGLAIDLGSSRTRAAALGRGVFLDVPTVSFSGDGTSYPVRRGVIVDADGTGRMLRRLLQHRVPRFGGPVIVLTTPVLGGVAYREAARSALGVLRPRTVLTVPTARAVALGARADLSRPLLVADIGAHLTEVFLLAEGAVVDARRVPLGTSDLDGEAAGCREITGAVTGMVAGMLRQDRTAQTLDALHRGVLLAGGGALRPEHVYQLSAQLHAPVHPAPAPHTAAVRGAAMLLEAAHTRLPAEVERELTRDP